MRRQRCNAEQRHYDRRGEQGCPVRVNELAMSQQASPDPDNGRRKIDLADTPIGPYSWYRATACSICCATSFRSLALRSACRVLATAWAADSLIDMTAVAS